MNPLSKRTKTLLAVTAGVIVVAVVALVVFAQAGGTELFGTAGVASITPSSSTIQVGKIVILSATPALPTCQWSNAEGNITFVNNVKTGASVTVQGARAGAATIKVNCSTLAGTAIVTVTPASTTTPTPTPTRTVTHVPTATATVTRAPTNTPTPLPAPQIKIEPAPQGDFWNAWLSTTASNCTWLASGPSIWVAPPSGGVGSAGSSYSGPLTVVVGHGGWEGDELAWVTLKCPVGNNYFAYNCMEFNMKFSNVAGSVKVSPTFSDTPRLPTGQKCQR